MEMMGGERIFYSESAREKMEKRRKRIYESFELSTDLKNFVTRYIPAMEGIQEKYMKVADGSYADITLLSDVLEKIEHRIGYLAEKSHDSEEEEEYVERLRILHEELLEKITAPPDAR